MDIWQFVREVQAKNPGVSSYYDAITQGTCPDVSEIHGEISDTQALITAGNTLAALEKGDEQWQMTFSIKKKPLNTQQTQVKLPKTA